MATAALTFLRMAPESTGFLPVEIVCTPASKSCLVCTPLTRCKKRHEAPKVQGEWTCLVVGSVMAGVEKLREAAILRLGCLLGGGSGRGSWRRRR